MELHIRSYQTAEELMSHIEGGLHFTRKVSKHYNITNCLELLDIAYIIQSPKLQLEYLNFCRSRIDTSNAVILLEKALSIEDTILMNEVCRFISRDQDTFREIVREKSKEIKLSRYIQVLICSLMRS